MGYAELVFETGARSKMQYDDESEVLDFVRTHTERAMNGEEGGPAGHPAERIARVYFYDSDPSEEDKTVSADALKDLIDGMSHDGKLNADQLSAALRDEASPTYPQNQGRFASQYKMKESKSMTGEEIMSGGGSANA
jgi:hypothetical protein